MYLGLINILIKIIQYYEKNNNYDVRIIEYFKGLKLNLYILEHFNLNKSDISTTKINFVCELLLNTLIHNLYTYKIYDKNLFEFILDKYLTTNKDLNILNILNRFYREQRETSNLITFKAFKIIHENDIDANILLAYNIFMNINTHYITETEINDILTYRINGDTILIYFINKYINNDIKDIDDFLDFYYFIK